jgi:hypothetical protein
MSSIPEPPPPPPSVVAEPSSKATRYLKTIGIPLVTFLVGIGVGVAGSPEDDGTEEAVPAATGLSVAVSPSPTPIPTPSPEPSPEPEVGTLTRSDVQLSLKILSKDNFGSAGSLIDYRVNVAVPGFDSLGLPEDGVWEVTYEVLGGEDGATIDTFNIYGDGNYDVVEGNASTPNVNTVLRVRVTDVEDISGFSD